MHLGMQPVSSSVSHAHSSLLPCTFSLPTCAVSRRLRAATHPISMGAPRSSKLSCQSLCPSLESAVEPFRVRKAGEEVGRGVRCERVWSSVRTKSSTLGAAGEAPGPLHTADFFLPGASMDTAHSRIRLCNCVDTGPSSQSYGFSSSPVQM